MGGAVIYSPAHIYNSYGAYTEITPAQIADRYDQLTPAVVLAPLPSFISWFGRELFHAYAISHAV